MIFCYGDVGSTLLEIPRLLGALVVAQVAGLVRWVFLCFGFRGLQNSRILFSLGCGFIKNARRFLVSSGGVGQKVGFLLCVSSSLVVS